MQAPRLAGFDADRPAFFGWLGVTYYLERDDVFRMLRGLAGTAAQDSQVVFDCMDREAFDGATPSHRARRLQGKGRLRLEPVKTGLEPRGLEADLAAAGWAARRNRSAEKIEAMYLGDRTGRFRVGGHLHRALAAS